MTAPNPAKGEGHALLAEYLASQSRKELLRFITCGSVDDGKSTLIGRLLYEARALFEDQLSALESDSKRVGTQGGALDFALLVDGLSAEREQGITIDVAYRFFATERRKYIVADTPGHEQYTRNMVTGASTADLAVILIDARKGVLTQTRRHSFLVNLIGIRRVVLAINKMDLVNFDREVFERIEAEYRAFAGQIGITDITAIPVAALQGENVVVQGATMPWYTGPTLLGHLDTVSLGERSGQDQPFRMSVQWVCRPNQEFRGYAGHVAAGVVRPGDPLLALPSGRSSRVARIVTADGDLAEAVAGQAVTITLADEIDASRGELFAAAASPPAVADLFDATVVWMAEEPMLTGRPYLLKCGTSTVSAAFEHLAYKTNVNTLEKQPATELALNEIGFGQLVLDRALPFDPYASNHDTGGFILIDRLSNNTVAAGLLHAGRRRSQNVHWQALDINKENRAAQKGQKSCVLWFTGLSGAGKSTIANLVEKQLFQLGRHTYLLDGDNVRHGLNSDLGFSSVDRVENIRRVGEVARLMADAGLIVLVSFISPFRAERAMARSLLPTGEFFEIYVDTTLAEAEQRDPKGLYRKARAGELRNFTGIDSPYEAPESAEIHLRTSELTAEAAAEQVVSALRAAGMIHRDWVFLP
jgi:bifunctional enzyme CysN/CysC